MHYILPDTHNIIFNLVSGISPPDVHTLPRRLSSTLLEFKAQFARAEEVVREAVIGRCAVFLNSLAVLLCGIALVGCPVVLRKFLRNGVHVVVAVGLCEDACRRYGKIFAVAFHYRRVWQWLFRTAAVREQRAIGRESVAVDYQCFGSYAKASMARCMARNDARRMLMRSISSGVTMPTAHATASRSICSRSM